VTVRRPAPSPPRLLFVRTDRLGETVLNLPVIHEVRKALPAWQLLFLVQERLCPLFGGHPDVDEVLAESVPAWSWWRRAWGMSRQWRAWGISTVVISNPKKEYHLAAWLAGIPTRAGYDRKWGFLLTHRLEDRRVLGERHEVEYNMQLLAALGLTVPSSVVLQLPVTKAGEEECTQLLEQLGVQQVDRLIVVHPWTSNPRKQWPLPQAQELLQRLWRMGVGRVVVAGGPEEAPSAQTLLRGLESEVVNVAGRLSLPALAALLRRARLMITNDSGPMHLAAAVGAPVVALFGTEDPGSHPRRWGPWGSGHTVIHKPLEQIAVDDVLAAVQPYLA